MGLGHVPEEPIRAEGASAELQRRQRGRAALDRAVSGYPTGGANGARGRWGEDLAARWYRQQGYTVLDRNWRCKAGELDLVVGRDRLVVFCEVKTRASDRYGVPAEAVDWRKQQRLRRIGAIWLATRQHVPGAELRFDVACILGTRLEVIEGAF